MASWEPAAKCCPRVRAPCTLPFRVLLGMKKELLKVEICGGATA
jgi:hypothetical protein